MVERFEAAAVVDNKDVKSFGVIRTLIEAILYTSGTKKERAIAIDLLIRQAIEDAKRIKSPDIYVFVEDESFAKILQKRYKFRKARGQALILDLNYEQSTE